MKKWLLIVAGVLLVACNSNEDLDNTPRELKLSVTEETVEIDGLDYSFDIVSGNGDYQLEVSGAKATLEGNRVKVELSSNVAELKITDKEE